MRLKIERDEARERFVFEQRDRYGLNFEPEDLRAYRAWCDTRLHSVIVSRDDISRDGIPDPRWHISVASESGVPRWGDFVAIVQALRPGVMFCVPLPPKQFWINVNPRVLHVWEMKDDALERQWREEGQVVRQGQRSGRFPSAS